MSPLTSVAPADRRDFAALFRPVAWLRTCVDSVLEGRCGQLFADPESGADTAWILAPPFWFPVGPADGAAADQLIEWIRRFGGLIVADEAWQSRVQGSCAERSSKAARTPFSASQLDLEGLRAMRDAGPDDTAVARVDARLAAEVASKISTDLVFETSFPTPQAFEAGGIGFCAIVNGRPAAAATSAFVSDDAIEVQVNTLRDFRGRGFATLASAALLVSCLERGVTPNWDTGDATSGRLARRLGYRPLAGYDWLEVAPP